MVVVMVMMMIMLSCYNDGDVVLLMGKAMVMAILVLVDLSVLGLAFED
jgi:hypothetical protein